MSKRGGKSDKSEAADPAMMRRLAEAVFLLILVAAVYLMLTLVSYHPDDPGWSRDAAHDQIHNLGGSFGAWVADLFLVVLGYMAYAAPLLIALAGFRV
ncbi:MAG: DNA translocase FtsK 4TM domain-containing protein, partial [Wenzhouxiangella sp.]